MDCTFSVNVKGYLWNHRSNKVPLFLEHTPKIFIVRESQKVLTYGNSKL